jgi:hypothetical protein
MCTVVKLFNAIRAGQKSIEVVKSVGIQKNNDKGSLTS